MPTKLIKWNVIGKITVIIAFTFIILALMIISRTSPASGYEISIYDVYPWYFWFFMIISIFLGQVIVLKDIFFPASDENYRLCFLGFMAIVIPIIILLFIPYIRGYPTYGRGDHLTHIGMVKDILQIGFIDKNDIYPNLHILTAILTQVCGCKLIGVVNTLSRFFFFLSPISIYIFFRIIFKKKNELKIALVFASSFLFFGNLSNYLAQCPQSFLITPFILYLYFKKGISEKNVGFSILFIIFIVGYILYHPLNSLLLTLTLICLLVAVNVYLKLKGNHLTDDSKRAIKEKSFGAILFMIFIFVAWYFSFSYIIGSFQKVFSSIFVDTGTGSFFERQVIIVSTYEPRILDIVELAVYKYGLYIIISLLAIVSLIYVFIKWYKNKEKFKLRFSFLSSGLVFLIFGILSAGALFMDVIVGWKRFIRWAVFFSFILISPVFCTILTNGKYLLGIKYKNGIIRLLSRSFKTVILCIILVMLLFLSIFTFYSSPNVIEANSQVTSMEWEGMKWFFYHVDEQNLIDEVGITHFRFYDAINGCKENKMNIKRRDTAPPDHFSYDNETSLGEYYNESRYVIINHLGRIFYPETYPDYPEKWRYNLEDFDKLLIDNTVISFYTNSNFEAFLAKPDKIKE